MRGPLLGLVGGHGAFGRGQSGLHELLHREPRGSALGAPDHTDPFSRPALQRLFTQLKLGEAERAVLLGKVRRDVRVEEAARALRGRKHPSVGPRVLGKVEASRLVERAHAEVVLRGGWKG